jgi:hypothetical protein
MTMLTLVLEGARMLRLYVHMNCALVLLHKRAMGALELTGLSANVFESHGWGLDFRAGKHSIFVKPFRQQSPGINGFGKYEKPRHKVFYLRILRCITTQK